MSELFTFERIGNASVSPGYRDRIYQYIEREVDSVFHQRILEPLFGRVSVREGQHNTIVVRFITTIHGKSHTVGITAHNQDFVEITEKEIANKLFHSFMHSFGSLALSAFLNPPVEAKADGEVGE